MYDFVTGDTGSKLEVTCKDSDTGVAVSLTGATVRLKWVSDGDVEARIMTVTSASGGVAEYQFAAGELEAPAMRFDVEITDASGYVRTAVDIVRIAVRPEVAVDRSYSVTVSVGSMLGVGVAPTI